LFSTRRCLLISGSQVRALVRPPSNSSTSSTCRCALFERPNQNGFSNGVFRDASAYPEIASAWHANVHLATKSIIGRADERRLRRGSACPPKCQIFVSTRFLHANRCPFRATTLRERRRDLPPCRQLLVMGRSCDCPGRSFVAVLTPNRGPIVPGTKCHNHENHADGDNLLHVSGSPG
jgi:hypothetical protein